MQSPISYLFVPGNRPERFDKAVAANPDAMILDLEDSVHPDSKTAARTAVRTWHEQTPTGACLRYIRLNGSPASALQYDLDWLINLDHPERCAGIVLPKAEGPEILAPAANQIARWNKNAHVIAIIETARGLQAVDRIASTPLVARLAFGSLDFSLDIQCQHTNDAFLFARSRIVLASRVAGLPPPIDGVTSAFKDSDVLSADVAHACSLGFSAKLCIHPSQVAAVHEGFLPTSEKLAWARRVVDAAGSGSHAIQVDGKMVDLPLIEAARKLLGRDVYFKRLSI
jgi:citrate lyase subunit beta/citryl-CoA lyase